MLRVYTVAQVNVMDREENLAKLRKRVDKQQVLFSTLEMRVRMYMEVQRSSQTREASLDESVHERYMTCV